MAGLALGFAGLDLDLTGSTGDNDNGHLPELDTGAECRKEVGRERYDAGIDRMMRAMQVRFSRVVARKSF
jgi:hypothetical protein